MNRWSGCLLVLFLLFACNPKTQPGGTTTATAETASFPPPADRRVMGGGEIEAAPTPLTDAELQQAASIATGELRNRKLADARTFFVHAEMLHDKSAPGSRRALVLHYRYEGDQTITTVVDLTAQRVVDVRTAAHVAAPLSQEEFEQARGMAMADARVAGALGQNRGRVTVEPLVLHATEGDPLFGHRVVRLLFRVDRDYLSAPIVLVDLTTRQVMIEPPRAAEHM
jgi:Cu2+-containing amine oxidase